jgi:hypothetical protein
VSESEAENVTNEPLTQEGPSDLTAVAADDLTAVAADDITAVAAEIEVHVAAAGWDRPPALFALVRAARFRADDPDTASRLGLDDVDPDTLTPIEQEELPDGALDEVLAQIGWPDGVEGCALSQEIVVLPPSVEAELSDDEAVSLAAGHPDRREARLVVAVVRGGASGAIMRLRAPEGFATDDIVTGPDLAPNLVRALLDTFD